MCTKYRSSTFFVFALFLFTGCTSHDATSVKEGFVYRGVYFGKHLSSAYKDGIRDGCETSRGIYHKSHIMFKNNNDYYNGWFIGRKKCRYLLNIDKEGDLVL